MPRRQHERKLRVVSRLLVAKRFKLGHQLRDRQIDLAVVNSAPGLLIRIDADHDPRAVFQNRVEQRVAELGAVAAEAGAPQRLRISAREVLRDTENRRRIFVARAQRRAQRLVQQHRHHFRQMSPLRNQPHQLHRIRRPAFFGGRVQRCDVVVGHRANRAHQPAMNFPFGQRPRHRLEDRRAQREGVRKFGLGMKRRAEKSRFPFFVLRRRRQNVVRLARSLASSPHRCTTTNPAPASPPASAGCRRPNARDFRFRRASRGNAWDGR